MSIKCTFILNRKTSSFLSCPGLGSIRAFSGRGRGRDNPDDTDEEGVGAIPKGTYYLIDRQSGGLFGFARDYVDAHGYGTTDRTKWFTLWNPETGDATIINGHRRSEFRLHPIGPLSLSDGCITVVDPADFDRLQRFLRAHKPDVPAPGNAAKAYGTVEVK